MVEEGEPKGYCLILNYKKFDNPEISERFGTDVDAESLEELFDDLSFKVRRHDNLKKEETRQELFKIGSETDHSMYSCFVLCILSHGNKNGGNIFFINYVINNFNFQTLLIYLIFFT